MKHSLQLKAFSFVVYDSYESAIAFKNHCTLHLYTSFNNNLSNKLLKKYIDFKIYLFLALISMNFQLRPSVAKSPLI